MHIVLHRINLRSRTLISIIKLQRRQTASSLLAQLSRQQVSTQAPLTYIQLLILFNMIGGNPAFKLYDVDPDTFEVMDANVFMGEFYVYSP